MKKFYQISGTDIFSDQKAPLKNKRRELNALAGTYEVKTSIPKADKSVTEHEAVPSNKWAYHITKGPDHPRKDLVFGDLETGTRFFFNAKEYIRSANGLAKTFLNGTAGMLPIEFDKHTPVLVL
jgi:hypothetical protein